VSARDDILRHPGVLATADAEIAVLLNSYRAEIRTEMLHTTGWAPCSLAWLTTHPGECAAAPRVAGYDDTAPPSGDVISHWHPKVTRAGVLREASAAYRRTLMAEYRAEVLNEAADELIRIADETEAKVAEHYGAASGIGPGSAEMVREAARTVRRMAESAGQVGSRDTEYRSCGADLGRDEPPFTCNRRIGHDGPCGPDRDDAGKVIRKDETTQPADFFQVGHGYTHRYGYDFLCVAITTHPVTGERLAIGWHSEHGAWHRPVAVGINQWNHEYDGAEPPADITEGGA
jgi:hypothetical protein